MDLTGKWEGEVRGYGTYKILMEIIKENEKLIITGNFIEPNENIIEFNSVDVFVSDKSFNAEIKTTKGNSILSLFEPILVYTTITSFYEMNGKWRLSNGLDGLINLRRI